MWEEGGLDLLDQRVDGSLETRCLGPRFLRHFRVGRVGELAGFRELLVVSLQLGAHFDQRFQVPVLAPKRCHSLLVSHALLIGELALYFRGTLDGVLEPVAEAQVSVLGVAAGLPYF